MGSYFWTRSINGIINILAHVFLFLILGANIFTLIVTTIVFSLDMYLSFIIWYYWQMPKRVENSSISNSEPSHELSVREVVQSMIPPHEILSMQEANRRDIQNNTFAKDFEIPVRLPLDSEDDESKNEEDKEQINNNLVLPSILNRRGKPFINKFSLINNRFYRYSQCIDDKRRSVKIYRNV